MAVRESSWVLVAWLGLGPALGCGEPGDCGRATLEDHDLGLATDLHAIDGSLIVGAEGLVVDREGTQHLSPATSLLAVSKCVVAEGCDSYIVGRQGAVWRDQGAGWARLDLGTSADLHDIARVDDQVIVVGDGVLRVWNAFEGPGVALDPVPPDPGGWGRLRDYAGHTVVGDAGAMYTSEDLHTWTRVGLDTSEDLLALGFFDDDPLDAQPSRLWAVGRAGTVLVRREAGWEPLETGLGAVDLLDFDAGFALASDHRVLRIDDAGGVETLARIERQPLALEAGFFGPDDPRIEVVGRAGLHTTLELSDTCGQP